MASENSIDEAIMHLAETLDCRAFEEFRDIEQTILRRSFAACGMQCYPDVTGPEDGIRADANCVCEVCGNVYATHPMDWRVIGYGDVPFLNILCDGRRVKL